MPRIPRKNRDLKLYVLRRDLFRVLGYILWVFALYMGAWSYNYNHPNYPHYRLIVGWKMAIWILFAVISGFLLFRIWKLFCDCTFSGIIEVASLSRSYSSSNDPGKGNDYDFRLNTYLTVRTESGKKRRIRFEQKPGFYLYYHEGNRVTHLHGLPYPVNTDPTAPHGYVCSACGAHHERFADRCHTCNHSLIDPQEICDREM